MKRILSILIILVSLSAGFIYMYSKSDVDKVDKDAVSTYIDKFDNDYYQLEDLRNVDNNAEIKLGIDLNISEDDLDLKTLKLDSKYILEFENTSKDYVGFQSVIKDDLGSSTINIDEINDLINTYQYFNFKYPSTLTLIKSINFDSYPIGPSNNSEILERQESYLRANLYYYDLFGGYPVINLPNSILIFQNESNGNFHYKTVENPIDIKANNPIKEFKSSIKDVDQIKKDLENGKGSISSYKGSESVFNQILFISENNLKDTNIACQEYSVGYDITEEIEDSRYLIPSIILNCEINSANQELNGYIFQMHYPIVKDE